MSEQLQAMSEAEYLAWEERQERPHEFDGFRPVAMNGGTVRHELIQGNLKLALLMRLRDGPCRPLGPNMRVPTVQGRYRYPDALVTCTRIPADAREVTDPVVLFEITSDSTERIDRSDKLVEYRAIPGVVRYVILEQHEARATVIDRLEDHWRIDVLRGDRVLALPEIGIELPLAEVYAGLDWADGAP